jgi:hypothetical protein
MNVLEWPTAVEDKASASVLVQHRGEDTTMAHPRKVWNHAKSDGKLNFDIKESSLYCLLLLRLSITAGTFLYLVVGFRGNITNEAQNNSPMDIGETTEEVSPEAVMVQVFSGCRTRKNICKQLLQGLFNNFEIWAKVKVAHVLFFF